MTAPQYARSSDPKVIEAVEEVLKARLEFLENAQAFANEFSTSEKPRFLMGGGYGRSGFYVTGIVSDASPAEGRWKLLYPGAYAPYASSPLNKRLRALSVKLPEIPGVPQTHWVASNSQGMYWLYPDCFAHDGTAYFSLSMLPDSGPDLGPEWEEILPSVWHAASEARQGK